MNAATITRVQNKGLRHQFAEILGTIRSFSIELFTAHGGWFAHDAAHPASGAFARSAIQRSAAK